MEKAVNQAKEWASELVKKGRIAQSVLWSFTAIVGLADNKNDLEQLKQKVETNNVIQSPTLPSTEVEEGCEEEPRRVADYYSSCQKQPSQTVGAAFEEQTPSMRLYNKIKIGGIVADVESRAVARSKS